MCVSLSFLSMQLLLHKTVSQNFLNHLFEATLCYLRTPTSCNHCRRSLIPSKFVIFMIFVKTLSFLDEYIADRSNVVTYHNRQSLGSIPEVAVTYLTLIANTSICLIMYLSLLQGSNYNFFV